MFQYWLRSILLNLIENLPHLEGKQFYNTLLEAVLKLAFRKFVRDFDEIF
jgi:hypothetical protein